MKSIGLLAAILAISASADRARGEEPFSRTVGQVQVGNVTQTSLLQVPFITWGGDIPTFYANGGLDTKAGTLFQNQGLNLHLVPGDDFAQQVRDYMAGKSPFLRGTFSMIGMASEVIGSDPRTRGVVILQLTWSAGDHMVARPTVTDYMKDLKGKTVVLQEGGPHVGLLDDILHDAKLKWEDINVIWAKDLTGSDNCPAAIFRKNPKVDACFVITPDMIGLCGGGKSTGTGAEGTVQGAKVAISTVQLSRSIADVYVCRKDFYDANKELVMKFIASYLKGCEDVVKMRDSYEAKKLSAAEKSKYLAVLKLAQDIYGKEVVKNLEEDAHGLLMDATFVGYPGNWKFFKWGTGNVIGFEEFAQKSIGLAVSRGFATSRKPLLPPDFDCDASVFAMLSDRSKPDKPHAEVTGREIKAGEDIVAFDINFLPDQTEFSARQYGDDFQRVVEMAARYGNAAFIIRGHADPTLTLRNLVVAGKKKGLLKETGTSANRVYILSDGKQLDFNSIKSITDLINSGQFDGVEDADPKQTLTAALSLSRARAETVRRSIVEYAKGKGLLLDTAALNAEGAGISEPIVPKPKNQEEANLNMRVQFRLVAVQAEVKSAAGFDF